MDQRFIISIDFEAETTFVRDIDSQVPSSSAMSVGKFLDAHTQESWFGKCDCAISEPMTKRDACREKIANEIYGYYGISVPRLRISRQSIPEAIKEAYALDIDHGYYVISRWLDRFDIYGYLPQFQSGWPHHKLNVTVENQSRTLKERGLGHILAVAHWLNDIDVMNPSGKNVGYQLQLDVEGKLYAKSCKIDPGYAFWKFSEATTENITEEIQLSTQNHRVAFRKLPMATQQEYLLTLKKIIVTSDEQIVAFFSHPNTKIALEDPDVKGMSDFVPLSILIERLKNRRDGLAKLHEAALQTVQEIIPITAPTTIPPILQRLYCQAKLQYETDVREKSAFYVPLDATVSPHSEERIPMQTLWESFLGIRSSLSLTMPATTTAASTTASAAASNSTSLTLASSSVLATQSTTQQKTVLLLLGASGSGKSLSTQLLVEHCWQAFLQNPQRTPVPLRIELKQFSERTVGQCIINTLFDEYRYSPAEIHQLQQYPFVFILDGYDELAGQAKIN